MEKKNIFKESLADAKLLKESAIATAKLSLEERLAPRLSEMFAKKINEMETEEDEEINLDELLAELDESETTGDEINESEDSEDLDESKKDGQEWWGSEAKEDKETLDEESEESKETEDDEEFDIENMDVEDLKGLIKDTVEELVASGELNIEDIDSDEKDESIEENESVEETLHEEDEEIDIDELLNEVKGDIEESKKAKAMEKELKEAKAALNESKLFNAKLLFTNKLLVNKNLSDREKVKLLENMDKAKSPREAKLIYESINANLNKKPIKENRIRGNASAAVKQLHENKTNIIEQDSAVLRMQKLVGLI